MDEITDFWNKQPCNIRHSNKPIGSREYYDEVRERRYFVEPHIPSFAEFGSWKGKKVLEIGCGIGTDALSFALAGADVTAVDNSVNSLAIAKGGALAYGLDNINFYLGNAEKLVTFLPVQKFDLIYSFGVLHHMPRPEKVLNQLHRYANSWTVLKIMLYHKYSWKNFWTLLKNSGQLASTAYYSEAQEGSPLTRFYSIGEALNLLGKANFAIIDISVDHIFSYALSEYKQYRYIKTPFFRVLPEPAFNWLKHKFGGHLCITFCLLT
jgi:SAM-dependent methyltransferase